MISKVLALAGLWDMKDCLLLEYKVNQNELTSLYGVTQTNHILQEKFNKNLILYIK